MQSRSTRATIVAVNDTIRYHIVNEIADTTSARDIVLIEVSLLKTINRLFKPESAAVYKFGEPKDAPANSRLGRAGEIARPR